MILVTGASGLSGSAIVREFARQGTPIRALVRSRDKAAALLELSTVETVEGDMSNPGTLATVFDGIDRALLLSSANQQMLEVQCTFIDAAKRAGVKHIIKFSGGEVGFDPSKFRFARMHEEIEDYLEQSGLAWTHLRPSQFMQVYLREAHTIVGKGAMFLPMAEVTLAPIDIEDIAKIAVTLLLGDGHHGKSFLMTGPEALSMADIAQCISRATQRTVRYVAIAPEDRRAMLLAAGAPPYFADAIYEQAIERLRNPTARVCLQTHETFQIKPTTFNEFAKRNAAVFGGKAVD
jgi:uncharacterized protein YbjT (DUF2867 family)